MHILKCSFLFFSSLQKHMRVSAVAVHKLYSFWQCEDDESLLWRLKGKNALVRVKCKSSVQWDVHKMINEVIVLGVVQFICLSTFPVLTTQKATKTTTWPCITLTGLHDGRHSFFQQRKTTQCEYIEATTGYCCPRNIFFLFHKICWCVTHKWQNTISFCWSVKCVCVCGDSFE